MARQSADLLPTVIRFHVILPRYIHRIAREHPVFADYRDNFRQTLRNDHPVERVPMMEWQLRQFVELPCGMCRVHLVAKMYAVRRMRAAA